VEIFDSDQKSKGAGGWRKGVRPSSGGQGHGGGIRQTGDR
jgi:hypothetical protein